MSTQALMEIFFESFSSNLWPVISILLIPIIVGAVVKIILGVSLKSFALSTVGLNRQGEELINLTTGVLGFLVTLELWGIETLPII